MKKKNVILLRCEREHHPSSSSFTEISPVITSSVNSVACIFPYRIHIRYLHLTTISHMPVFGASVGVHFIYAYSLCQLLLSSCLACRATIDIETQKGISNVVQSIEHHQLATCADQQVSHKKIHAQIMTFHCPTSFEHKNPQIHAQIGNRGSHCYALLIQVIPTKKR